MYKDKLPVHPLTWTHRQGKADPLDTTTQRTDNDLVERLTPREIEVLRLVAEGCDNQTIAALLMLDRATIRAHVDACVLTKLRAQ